MSKRGVPEPQRYNVFAADGMLVHDGGRCEFTAPEAERLAARTAGSQVGPASGAAAEVDAAIRLARLERTAGA
jgi:hypothetical protein